MSELRVALVGCGDSGEVHLRRWAEVSASRIVGICDSDPIQAARLGAAQQLQSHTDWRALLNSDQLDVVDICTPPADHASIAMRALDRGAHVLCETPLAATSLDAKAIIDRAALRERLVMPAFGHRFHPPILFVKDLIENDDLGRIVMFRSRFSGLFPDVPDRWVSDRTIAGSGILMDTAIHSIDLFRHLVCEVSSAAGKLATFNPAFSIEDSAALVLKGEMGAIGVIDCSWSTPGGRNVLEVYGTAGACFVDYECGQVRYKTADMAVWETREIAGPDRYERLIGHFADAVRGIQGLEVTGQDGLRALEVVETIVEGG